MATGGPSDSNAKIDLQTFWPEKDVQFMASMLRGTGKFHVVPIYETEDELTYEEEENETQYTSSAMDTTTPKSFSGQAKNYRAVKPPTPKAAHTAGMPPPQTPNPTYDNVVFGQPPSQAMANMLRQPPTNMKAVHAPAVPKHHILNPTYDRVDPTYLPPQPDMGLPSMKFAPTSQTPITEPPKGLPFHRHSTPHVRFQVPVSSQTTVNPPALPQFDVSSIPSAIYSHLKSNTPLPITTAVHHTHPIKQEQVDTYPKSTFSPVFPFHPSYQSHQPQLPSPKPQYSYPHTVPSHPPTVPSQNVKQEIIYSAPPPILKHYPDVQTTHSFHHPGGDQTVTYPSVPSPYSASMLNSTALASMRAPQLPPFSGESQKGDVSFEVWKYELLCAINDGIYPNALILQSVRRSLKGRARDILLTMEATAAPSDILNKLEGIYGIVSSRQILLQQFYLEAQHDHESVADYSVRIENLLRRATVSNTLVDSVKHEMLCSKLWNGLKDPLLKNSSRYKFETVKDFNILRRDIRAIEQDLLTSRHTTEEPKQLLQNVASPSTMDKKIDNLVDHMKSLRQKLDDLEKKYEDACKTGKAVSSSDGSANTTSSQASYTPRGRGSYNYQRRGRGRGRGGSGRGFYSRQSGYQNQNKNENSFSKSNQEN